MIPSCCKYNLAYHTRTTPAQSFFPHSPYTYPLTHLPTYLLPMNPSINCQLIRFFSPQNTTNNITKKQKHLFSTFPSPTHALLWIIALCMTRHHINQSTNPAHKHTHIEPFHGFTPNPHHHHHYQHMKNKFVSTLLYSRCPLRS